MIIFGTNISSYKSYSDAAYDCDHCDSRSSVDMTFATRYFHIFWIPVFPLGKTGISQCHHCKRTLYRNQMSPQFQSGYDNARQRVKTPAKYFVGLILGGFFFALAFFAAATSRQNSQSWIQAPKVGDVYEVNDAEGYTLYKVTQVTPDSLTLIPHEYIVGKSSQLRKLKRSNPDDYDETAVFALSTETLKAMYDARTIRAVDRK